jgi:hypothetical protein
MDKCRSIRCGAGLLIMLHEYSVFRLPHKILVKLPIADEFQAAALVVDFFQHFNWINVVSTIACFCYVHARLTDIDFVAAFVSEANGVRLVSVDDHFIAFLINDDKCRRNRCGAGIRLCQQFRRETGYKHE